MRSRHLKILIFTTILTKSILGQNSVSYSFSNYLSGFCEGSFIDSSASYIELQIIEGIRALKYNDYVTCKNKMELVLNTSSDTVINRIATEILGNILVYEKDWSNLFQLLQKDKIKHKNTDSSDIMMYKGFSKVSNQRYRFVEKKSVVKVKQKFSSKNPMIKVDVNGKQRKGYFDTGAGITIVSKSFAKNNGVVFYEESGSAKSASNKNISFATGYIPEIKIGGFVAYNHPVGIVNDELFEFKKFGIKVIDIDLVIGWTLIQEMTVLIDYKRNEITIKEPIINTNVNKDSVNLFWYNAPIVKIQSNLTISNLFFDIDLGGSESNLYEPIINKLSDTSVVRKKELQFGGAGGFTNYIAFIISPIKLIINNKEIEIANMRTRPLTNTFNNFKLDGVIGGGIGLNHQIFIDPKNGIFKLIDN